MSNSLTDLDPQTGAPVWQYSAPNGLLGYTAIRQDGGVVAFERDPNSGVVSLEVIDGNTGARLFGYPLPQGSSTETRPFPNNCSPLQTFTFTLPTGLSQPVVDSDGSIYMLYGITNQTVNAYQPDCYHETDSYVINTTTSLLKVSPDGSVSQQTIKSDTQTAVQTFGPDPTGTFVEPQSCSSAGPTTSPDQVIPDGQGGVLATTSEVPSPASVCGGFFNIPSALVTHLSTNGGGTYSLRLSSVSQMVLGENGVAFALGGNPALTGTDILSFDMNSGQILWTYEEPSGDNTVSIVAATSGNGLVAKEFNLDNTETVVRFDSTGSPTRDTWTGTGISYWAGTLWPALSVTSQLSANSASLIQFSTAAWPAPDMFGTDQAVQKINVTNFSQTGTNQTTIINTLQKIQTALPSYDSCNGWLQGAGSFQGLSGIQQIQNLLSGNYFGHGTVNRGTKPAPDISAFSASLNPDGKPVPGLPENPAPVFTVNDIGAFFNAADTQGRQFVVGTRDYAGNTVRAQLAILLHELAHQITVSGFQNDFGIPKAGKANDKLVDTNCRALIEGQ